MVRDNTIEGLHGNPDNMLPSLLFDASLGIVRVVSKKQKKKKKKKERVMRTIMWWVMGSEQRARARYVMAQQGKTVSFMGVISE